MEGDAEQWRWYVPHDVRGLIELLGGKAAFVLTLNEYFVHTAEFKGTALPNPYYWAGNEPSILGAWLFSWAGTPPGF